MSIEELKTWFWNKFNSCYVIKHENYPKSYFMIYDEKYIRYKKFARITGNEIEPPNIKEGICLFEQDYKNGYFLCDWYEIWPFFEKNYSSNYNEIRELIDGWLKETDKLSALSTLFGFIFKKKMLKETDKLSALSTSTNYELKSNELKETDKLSALSTICFFLQE